MHWLDHYRSHLHDWHDGKAQGGGSIYYRRLGVVETAFDHDHTDFEGRADVNCLLTVAIKSTLDKQQFRDRLMLAWACMRLHHVLMSAVALDGSKLPTQVMDVEGDQRYFLIRVPTFDEALRDAETTLVWIEDHYAKVDPRELYRHCMNTARVVDEEEALARMFVLPLETTGDGKQYLRFLSVAAHQVTDGFSSYTTHTYFVGLLNKTRNELLSTLKQLVNPAGFQARLPPSQESLYPPVPGNIARQRWFWAISRMFRHTRRRPPTAFPNPLRRAKPLPEARALEPNFSKLFDYNKKPPLNTFMESATVSPIAARRIQRLCRDVGVSIGAGCFALCALVMMKLQEELYPADEQPHFVGYFPLNPRPFLAKGAPLLPSIMLAFSDGLHLPFLPSHLNLDGRFRVLVRQANRQLRVYQKGTRASQTQPLGLTHPSQLLPSNYIAAVERVEDKLPAHRKQGLKPQGEYPAAMGTGSTCGVSSIGARSQFSAGAWYDLNDSSKDFIADFVDLGPSVRARDGECLIGSAGDDNGLYFNASYDANALDEKLVKRWKEVMETLFEPISKESRL